MSLKNTNKQSTLKKKPIEHNVVIKKFGMGVFIIWATFALLLLFMDLKTTGVYGDSFNVLTSLFTGFALLAAMYAIIIQARELDLQRTELRLQRKELKLQRKEMHDTQEVFKLQTFQIQFEYLLKCHDEMWLKEVVYFEGTTKNNVNGEKAIEALFNNLTEIQSNQKNMKMSEIEIQRRKIHIKILGYFKKLSLILVLLCENFEKNSLSFTIYNELLKSKLSFQAKLLIHDLCYHDDGSLMSKSFSVCAFDTILNDMKQLYRFKDIIR